MNLVPMIGSCVCVWISCLLSVGITHDDRNVYMLIGRFCVYVWISCLRSDLMSTSVHIAGHTDNGPPLPPIGILCIVWKPAETRTLNTFHGESCEIIEIAGTSFLIDTHIRGDAVWSTRLIWLVGQVVPLPRNNPGHVSRMS